jgi:hypothetical protein
MKAHHLVKKFRNLTTAEERQYALTLDAGSDAIKIINKYLAKVVDGIDTELNNTSALYSKPGDNALRVAALLARREAHYTLLLLLQKDIELDVDQTKD